MNLILEVRDVYKHFGGIRAIDNCSFDVKEHHITGLIGPNGAGKTTMFNIITGFYKPDEGHIAYKGKHITHLKPFKRTHLGIARTFQMIRLFPKMTVLDNLLTSSNRVNEGVGAAIFNLDLILRKKHKDQDYALELLELVGLSDKADALAEELSYGQQKLVEIIRAMVAKPDLLMLDEPASGVNLTILEKIKQLIADYKQDKGTVLLIEHNMKFVMELCDEIIVLDYGKFLTKGTPEQIQSHEGVIEAYLGKRKDNEDA